MKASTIIDSMHGERQIVPSEMRVSTAPLASLPKSEHAGRRRFNDVDWKSSQLRRELRDRPSFTEAVTLQADHALTVYYDNQTRRETGRRVVMFPANIEPLLAIAPEPPAAFEFAPSIQAEATIALAKLSRRASDYKRRASDKAPTVPVAPSMGKVARLAMSWVLIAVAVALSVRSMLQ